MSTDPKNPFSKAAAARGVTSKSDAAKELSLSQRMTAARQQTASTPAEKDGRLLSPSQRLSEINQKPALTAEEERMTPHQRAMTPAQRAKAAERASTSVTPATSATVVPQKAAVSQADLANRFLGWYLAYQRANGAPPFTVTSWNTNTFEAIFMHFLRRDMISADNAGFDSALKYALSQNHLEGVAGQTSAPKRFELDKALELVEQSQAARKSLMAGKATIKRVESSEAERAARAIPFDELGKQVRSQYKKVNNAPTVASKKLNFRSPSEVLG